jgi:formylglycine-generating enzyme
MKIVGTIVLLLAAFLHVDQLGAVTIPTVPVGNPGNAADTRYMAGGVGSVGYGYLIGKTEITNAQYVEFLNSVAASDPYSLFHENMELSTFGGIVRSGSPGSFTYSVKPHAFAQGPGGSNYNFESKPVVFVSWYDSLRFANWMHNGQGTGDTENGAYTLLGGTQTPSNGESITRNQGARWWLPSESEWYKAAYYDPAAGVYYDEPAGTNLFMNNNLPANDTGNSGNFRIGDTFTTGNTDYPLTDAGAYTQSESPYGTFDQGGNVMEWNEALISTIFRGIRGGAWNGGPGFAHAFTRDDDIHPTLEGGTIGFRVATIPEPSSLCLGLLGALALCRRMTWAG